MEIAEKQPQNFTTKDSTIFWTSLGPSNLKNSFSEKSWCNLKKDAPVSFILL